MSNLGQLLPFVLVGGIAVVVAVLFYRRHRAIEEGFARLLARDGLVPTQTPCGLGARELATRFDATPRGDRRYGVRYGVQGPARAELAGAATTVEVAAFQWWYEVRVQTNKSTSYQRRTTTVAMVRLPVVVPGFIRLRPEGLLGRVGLRRADQQLESDEFNRRFHVRGSDPTLNLRFLDAAMQHRLLTSMTGRTIHLERDLLVLGGAPDHRDTTLPGPIAELPAVGQDALTLLRSVPAQLWRVADAVGGDQGPN